MQRYNYTYDAINRLKNSQFSNPELSLPHNGLNNETINYDFNGNIANLQRTAKSLVNGSSETIDNLTYNYVGNRVISINDGTGNATGYEGGGDQILYDANGNMTGMPDKNIENIAYNILNLPNSFSINNQRNLQLFLYRADGVKLRKIFHATNVQHATFSTYSDYLDGFQYLQTQGSADIDIESVKFANEQEAFLPELKIKSKAELQFFPTAEGFYDYVKKEYIYQYKDHLGNVRISYRKDGNSVELTDQNDYYPFGMNIPRAVKSMISAGSLYNYKYNDKELQETGFVFMDYRNYAPDIARFIGQDRVSEVMPDWTPYRFAFNNPVYFSDPTGLSEQGLATCPNCPKIELFKTFIDDQNDEFFYESDTNTVTKVAQIEEVIIGSNYSQSVNYAAIDNNISSGLWFTNTAMGAASAYTVYKGQYHLNNELWRYQPSGRQKIITPWSKMKNGRNYWKNNFASKARLSQLEKVKGIRNISSKLTKAGGVLIATDIVLSGEIKPSHIINAAMLGASTTGVGAIFAGAWFVADFGTMGANYLLNNEVKGLGDMLDESVGTYEIYDGIY